MLRNSRQSFMVILSLALTVGIIGNMCFALQDKKDDQLLLPDTTTIESMSNRRTQPEGKSEPVKNTLTKNVKYCKF